MSLNKLNSHFFVRVTKLFCDFLNQIDDFDSKFLNRSVCYEIKAHVEFVTFE